jgi:glucose/arabinose dehydrogenase
MKAATRVNTLQGITAAIIATWLVTIGSAAGQTTAPTTPTTPAAPQTPVVTTPGAMPAAPAPPSWQQGRGTEHTSSTLHPIAAILTGREAKELPMDKLKLPPGFHVEVYADGIPEARSLALGDKGTVFVTNRILSDVYAIVDNGGKRDVKKILKGLKAPNGVAFHDGTLYIAERTRITAYAGIEDRLDNPPEARVVIDNLDPTAQPGHYWKYLAYGPDGKLYFNVGSPGNIVMPNYQQASLNRVDPKTGTMETIAHGVRNSVGFDWDPKTHDLWFTNNARDWITNDIPQDTLGHITHKNMHFGFPYCHQGDFLDPEFGKGRSCGEFDTWSAPLGAHVAPLGMKFYNGSMFPAEYKGAMFIALHGSWNRDEKQGYNVVMATKDAKGKVTMKPFLDGFMTDAKADPPMWGRPVDLLVMKDGSMLVSDDYNGIVYRITYKK